MAMTKLGRRHIAAALLRQTPQAVLPWAPKGYASSSDPWRDVVVIGGGPGGYVTAIKAAQLGLKTTCIERPSTLGGSCSGVGCIPSSTSAPLHNGVRFRNLDNVKIYNLKNVRGVTCATDGEFKGNRVDFLMGTSRMLSPSKVEVDLLHGGTTIIDGRNVIVAPSSSVRPIAGCQIDEKKILSSAGALSIEEIPSKAVIIGAEYSAIEMASVWTHLGSEVVLIDSEPQVALCMDAEFRMMFMEELTKHGMQFILNTNVLQVDSTSTGVRLLTQPAATGDKIAVEADIVVVSCTVPDIDCLGLDNVGVTQDFTGKIIVNNHLMTNCPGIYAIGSSVSGPIIPHKAEEDGLCSVKIIAGREAVVDYDTVPCIIYALPEVASIGKTEEQLKASGVQYTVSKYELQPYDIFKRHGSRKLKVLCEMSGRTVGMHLMGPNAGEMVREAMGSLKYGASAAEISRACNSDGALREAIRVSCFQSYLNAIHN